MEPPFALQVGQTFDKTAKLHGATRHAVMLGEKVRIVTRWALRPPNERGRDLFSAMVISDTDPKEVKTVSRA